jgi:hypothetical protein
MPRGLALFLQKGMPAWLTAWTNPRPIIGKDEMRPIKSRLPESPKSELTMILAGMILQYREVSR